LNVVIQKRIRFIEVENVLIRTLGSKEMWEGAHPPINLDNTIKRSAILWLIFKLLNKDFKLAGVREFKIDSSIWLFKRLFTYPAS